MRVSRRFVILDVRGGIRFAIPPYKLAILLTAYLGGAVATQARIASPVFSHMLFGVYLGVMLWGGLYLRDDRLRALIPYLH